MKIKSFMLSKYILEHGKKASNTVKFSAVGRKKEN